ncbi:Transcriptional regulator, LysR family [uncultured Alphaproteobacteria bacterium]|uniref:Transcriptional regulator, LysR family n=1 Tax=uncultured Alphaproteobacteria bacterium TaxID=91750 RepID=A0A212J9N2_9PROT|nr:Transcriptional regulator, LysR family [uncultured Alphaproteobacteria bacterium]
MDFRTLRAFVEVLRRGGFSAAAASLNSTQPTVSKSVKQLEDELGAPLIDRARMTATAAGEIALKRAQAILAERDDLLRELGELRGLKRGALSLGISPIGGSTLFAPLFAVYAKRYPQIDIRLQEQGSRRLEEMVMEGEVELAASLLPVGGEFDFQPVRTEPMVALLPPGHPARGRATVTVAALRDTPQVLFDSAFAINRLVEDAFARRGVAPEVAARSGQIDFMVELVAAGLGVAFMPESVAALHRHPSVAAVRFAEPGTDWQLALVWRKSGYLSAAARAWLDLTAEVYPVTETLPTTPS